MLNKVKSFLIEVVQSPHARVPVSEHPAPRQPNLKKPLHVPYRSHTRVPVGPTKRPVVEDLESDKVIIADKMDGIKDPFYSDVNNYVTDFLKGGSLFRGMPSRKINYKKTDLYSAVCDELRKRGKRIWS